MRIERISIDGYGRCSSLTIPFAPGLQIIIGPNEQGKSTIRSYIGDMLYGQKRGTTQRLYDESNELRLPWANPDCYGGGLCYRLDDGTLIEVLRNFDQKRESCHIYDRTRNHDITNDFDLLRNREFDFATRHLGLSKEVFLSTATIGHFTLDELGDRDALMQVREKLLTLSDSGDDTHSADMSLRLLQQRIGDIGQPASRTRPLPAGRGRLLELNREYERAVALQQELGQLRDKRQEIVREIAQLRERRLAREEDFRLLEAHHYAARLNEVEDLLTKVNQVTQQCFSLGSVREFPLERVPQVQRAETLVATAKVQLERTRAEHDNLLQQLKNERQLYGADAGDSAPLIPDDLEARYAERAAALQHLRERVVETETLVQVARTRLKDTQGAVASLPDFSRLSPDPVEYMTQLSSSFTLAVRTRDEELMLTGKLRVEVETRGQAKAAHDALFNECQDFSEQAREYELEKRVQDDQIVQRRSALQVLQSRREEVLDDIPGFSLLAVLCGVFLIGVIVAYFSSEKWEVLYAVPFGVIASLYFVGQITWTRTDSRRIDREIEELQLELDRLEGRQSAAPGLIERMMEKSGCQTVRELEALHEQYRNADADFTARAEALHQQEFRAHDAQERVEKLLSRIRESFASVGEEIHGLDDVQTAAARAIESYQDYRETKRRVTDSRAVLEKHEMELKRLNAAVTRAQEAQAEVEAEVRAYMRDSGFAEEQSHATTAAALRAFRGRMANKLEQRGRIELLQERSRAMERQLRAEELEVEKHHQELLRLLAHAGLSSVEQWHETAAKAKEYRELWVQRTTLEEQLNGLLRGQNINELRQLVQSHGTLPPAPPKTREQLKSEIDAISISIDDLMGEEHELHISMTQRSGGVRALNEIEEDRAALERQVQQLELEFEAATYAMAIIEDVAQDTRAVIAPGLARRASEYVAEITDGHYSEVLIGRDLAISVRIPETSTYNEAPEKSLSKGTVDQVYLGLRLALVRGMSDQGESIPMLLDDPFANYDDARLERTLRLLSRIGKDNQVLLFTCREDVARAAEAIEAPVIRL